jgi:deazaflavin-dependent oxidoreductase (nitroreductase family)
MSAMDEFNQPIIDEFRANEGKVAAFGSIPIVLLTTTGAKSGKKRLNPLAALVEEDGTVYVFASKAGAPTDPDWYRNLVAHPDVEVEIGTNQYTAKASAVDGAKRDEIYERQKAVAPQFSEYEEKTNGIRTIPVVALTRTGS